MLWLTLHYNWSNTAVAATFALLPILAIGGYLFQAGW